MHTWVQFTTTITSTKSQKFWSLLWILNRLIMIDHMYSFLSFYSIRIILFVTFLIHMSFFTTSILDFYLIAKNNYKRIISEILAMNIVCVFMNALECSQVYVNIHMFVINLSPLNSNLNFITSHVSDFWEQVWCGSILMWAWEYINNSWVKWRVELSFDLS